MIKKILIGVVIAAALGGAVVYYFYNKPEPVVDSVFRAVPLDAALLVDIKDYQSFNNCLVAGKPNPAADYLLPTTSDQPQTTTRGRHFLSPPHSAGRARHLPARGLHLDAGLFPRRRVRPEPLVEPPRVENRGVQSHLPTPRFAA